MNLSELILDLKNKDIYLLLNDGQLKINGPKGALNDELITTIKQNKEEIIKILKNKHFAEEQQECVTKQQEFWLTEYSVEAAAKTINTPFIRLNKNGKRNIYCFPPLPGFGVWCSSLSSYINNFTFISFNFINKENLPAFYADLIINDSPSSEIIILGYSAGGSLAYEVAKELELRNIRVSDIIIFDILKMNKQFVTKEEVESYGIFNLLDRHNFGFLKDKVFSIISAYMYYTRNTINAGIVKANIHHVITSGAKESNLASLTQSQYREYKGFGIHTEMFAEANIKGNAELLNSILLSIN